VAVSPVAPVLAPPSPHAVAIAPSVSLAAADRPPPPSDLRPVRFLTYGLELFQLTVATNATASAAGSASSSAADEHKQMEQ